MFFFLLHVTTDPVLFFASTMEADGPLTVQDFYPPAAAAAEQHEEVMAAEEPVDENLQQDSVLAGDGGEQNKQGGEECTRDLFTTFSIPAATFFTKPDKVKVRVAVHRDLDDERKYNFKHQTVDNKATFSLIKGPGRPGLILKSFCLTFSRYRLSQIVIFGYGSPELPADLHDACCVVWSLS